MTLTNMIMALSLAVAGVPVAKAVHVVAGPLIGSVTPDSARVWIQLSTSDRVKVRCFDVTTGQQVSAMGTTVLGPPPFIVNAALNDLLPDHDYRISLVVNGRPLTLPPPLVIIHTVPAPGAFKPVHIAFGSGADTAVYPHAAIWRSITRLQPQAFIFAGNTAYLPRRLTQFPYTYMHAYDFILARYDQARMFGGLRRLCSVCPIYATWDDRDFGTPHSDSSFVFAHDSFLAFEQFWPNPAYGSGTTLGTFCHFRISDVAVFLLDDRSFRVNPTDHHRGQMLGARQIAWLQRYLLNSTATFKLIVDGDQMLANYPGHEGWSNFPRERRSFIHWIFGHNVGGVVFLSGHRRFGELTCRPANPNGLDEYPLYDLTSSSLAARPIPTRQLLAWPNARRIDVPVFAHNFGFINVGGPPGNRHITLQLRNAQGNVVLSKTILASALQGQ
ncbi:MAG: alkaline phosphatase D family protein [Phycisphaerae bacterium]